MRKIFYCKENFETFFMALLHSIFLLRASKFKSKKKKRDVLAAIFSVVEKLMNYTRSLTSLVLLCFYSLPVGRVYARNEKNKK